ncbi:MAG: transcriptional regulator Spx [Firmicutes bacterium]|nr:transcriptional regulator Spx [Bacillota bacterium]
MVILYTSPGCASCRKAKQWLKDNNIEFIEKNIFTTLLDANEIKYILARSENGTDDIISVRSKAFQSLQKDIDDYTIDELVTLIQENPSILKRPIMISEKNFVVGYDNDEITKMMSSDVRNLPHCCDSTCPNYVLCGSIREAGEA